MYTGELFESMKRVEAARAANATLEPRRMTAEEKDALLETYHPDYKKSEFAALRVGVNRGDAVPHELAALLEGRSRVDPAAVDLTRCDYETDVLVIGGGGAGSSAAIEADRAGMKTMIVTKLRIGDANTMMAEGGIQAADKPNDSPAIHYLDAFGGGHFAAGVVASMSTGTQRRSPARMTWSILTPSSRFMNTSVCAPFESWMGLAVRATGYLTQCHDLKVPSSPKRNGALSSTFTLKELLHSPSHQTRAHST